MLHFLFAFIRWLFLGIFFIFKLCFGELFIVDFIFFIFFWF